MLHAVLIFLVALAIFYTILTSSLSGLAKFILTCVEMFAVSFIISKRYDLDTELGFVLLKSKRGIAVINELAKHKKIWSFFSDVGTTISYGVIGAFLMRKNTNAASFAVGLCLLLLLSFFVAPFALHYLSSVMTGSGFEKKVTLYFGDERTSALVLLLALLLGGFSLVLLLGVVYYGAHIAILFFQLIFFGNQGMAAAQPGGTLLLPGVNLPFLEGLLALVVILVVHEGAHAVLARMANVPINSSGIVLLGIIPVGAFVEPDEKVLSEITQKEQTRVYVAGSTANFITAIIFFVLFIAAALLLRGLSSDSLFYSALNAIYSFLGLTFSINFVVATVNLLPLPFFDGYRILELNVSDKRVVKAFMYLTLAAFIFNFLPWFFSD
ncbi:MAG: site-2 protease family protein [Candidatus Bilamarchaeaceae archaeon]